MYFVVFVLQVYILCLYYDFPNSFVVKIVFCLIVCKDLQEPKSDFKVNEVLVPIGDSETEMLLAYVLLGVGAFA
jgi:hypothetical protein